MLRCTYNNQKDVVSSLRFLNVTDFKQVNYTWTSFSGYKIKKNSFKLNQLIEFCLNKWLKITVNFAFRFISQ